MTLFSTSQTSFDDLCQKLKPPSRSKTTPKSTLPLSNDDTVSTLSSVEPGESKDPGHDQGGDDTMDVVDNPSSHHKKSSKESSTKKPNSQYGMYTLSNPEGYRRGGTSKRPPRAVSANDIDTHRTPSHLLDSL
jgi:hypothetical protein